MSLIVSVTPMPGELSRYGNPPGWVVEYDCGHKANKQHSGDLSTKAILLKREPKTYIRGQCQECPW